MHGRSKGLMEYIAIALLATGFELWQMYTDVALLFRTIKFLYKTNHN